jgi:single-stranded DNA-binding protein
LRKAAEPTSRQPGAGDETRWVNVISFSDHVIAELLRLQEGDCISVQGQLNASVYTGADGTAKESLSIVASNVLALRQPPKERKPKAAMPDTQDPRTRQERLAGTWTAASGDPNDEVPFGGEA